jgi:hypothetical protein
MGSDERRSARSNVILTAVIEHERTCIPVRIGNLSEHGALVIGDGLPAGDTQITFRCNGQAVEGWVAWSEGSRAGINFGSPTAPDALTKKRAGSPFSITKDTREPDFRRPGFRGNQLTDEERRIVQAWTAAQSKPS